MGTAGKNPERRDGARRIEDRLLKRLARDSGEVLSVVDPAGVLTYLTPAAERLVGWSGTEMVGKPAAELYHPDDYQQLHEPPAAGERRRGTRLRVRHRDGSWREVEARTQALTSDAAEGGLGMVVFSRDITDESTARRKLRVSEQRLRDLIENAPIGITELSLDGHILDVNPEVCALLGYRREELVGMAADSLVSEEELDARNRSMRALMNGTVESATYEVGIRSQEGRALAAEVIVTILRNGDGSPRSLLALMQDVTDRRRLETQVQEQAELINHAHDAIFVKRLADGIITFWNPAAAALYGYSGEEAVGRASEDLLRTEYPDGRRAVEEVLTRTGGWSGDLVHLIRSGEPVWVESRWALIRDRAGMPQAVLEVDRDVTAERHLADDRERLMQILERQNRELRETDRLKTEFLLTISHELRTPLTAILGFADLLTMDSPLAERTELEIIQRNGRRLLTIIEDVLTIAQVQAGEMKLRPHPVNVSGVLRRVVDDARPMVAEKSLHFEALGLGEPAWAIADEMATSHVLRHLVDNAIKFTSEGTVTVAVRRQGDQVRVEIEDTGIGVPPEARELIFEDFRQVDQSMTRRYGGLGIGLSVVRRLMVLQQGTLGLEDRPGGGSLFWISLPAEVSEEAAS